MTDLSNIYRRWQEVHKWGDRRTVDLRKIFVDRTEHFCISSFEDRQFSKLKDYLYINYIQFLTLYIIAYFVNNNYKKMSKILTQQTLKCLTTKS